MKLTLPDIIRELGGETDYRLVSKRLKDLSYNIQDIKYYILDFNNPLNPKPVGRYYETYDQAYQAIESSFGGNHNVFIIMRGKDLRKYIKKFKIKAELRKYNYKKGLTDQQKKSYRTKLRRHIRILRARELNEWAFNQKIDRSLLPSHLQNIENTKEGKRKVKNYLSLLRKKYYRTLA